MPASGDNLHVRSRCVIVDGSPTDAVVELDVADHLRVVSITPMRSSPGDGSHVTDLGSVAIVPAPLDLHFHGVGGHVVPPGGSVASIDEALAATARATDWRHQDLPAPAYEWLATLPIPGMERGPDLVDDIAREVAACARAITSAREARSTGCVGIRIEGLFLNPTRAGIWPPEHFLPPSPTSLDPLVRAAADEGTPLVVVDLAPEMDYHGAAADFIARARELDVTCSLAHTDADWEQARTAIDAGVTLATHTWNAMRATSHRDPGVIAAVLADPRVTCELICDGVHLHPGAIALSIAACGTGNWVVVSDASPFAGTPVGDYEWAGTRVHHDGTALRDPEGRLAGSASLGWRARDVLALAGTSQLDAALALGATPRRVLDPARPLGLLIGDPAWILPIA